MKPIRFIHISDTHIGPTYDFELYEKQTAQEAEKLISHINNLPYEIDFVVHTGDIVNDPIDAPYPLAHSILKSIKYPTYYVTGNHDFSKDIKTHLEFGPKTDLDNSPNKLFYKFTIQENTFIVLDAAGPREMDAEGILSEEHLEILEQELKSSNQSKSIFVHFPPFPLDCPWIEDFMLLQNGDKLHKILKQSPTPILGVFFGHVHRSMHIQKDNISYISSGSSFCQFGTYPESKNPEFENHWPGHYNLVTVYPDQITCKQYFF